MAKRWQKTELDYLKRHAEAKTTAELAKHLRVAPASVGAKLGELGLRAKPDAPGKPAAAAPVDPQLALYEQGVRAMYRARWAEAVRCFTQVATASDEPGLAERARQQAAACEQKQAEQGAGHAEAADPFLLAVYEKNRGDYEAALQICVRGGRQTRDERFAYLAASIHALREEHEAAQRLLDHSIELNPKNRVHAFHDPDFATLRERGEIADRLRA
jgi:tetratricopeptide (TPR) repeat protein